MYAIEQLLFLKNGSQNVPNEIVRFVGVYAQSNYISLFKTEPHLRIMMTFIF